MGKWIIDDMREEGGEERVEIRLEQWRN